MQRVLAVGLTWRQNAVLNYWKLSVHIHTVYLDIIKVLFIHQLMHQWVVLKKQH